MTSLKEIIPVFNETLQNEFEVRMYGETDAKIEIFQNLFGLSKSLRLSTMFTRSGLELIVNQLIAKRDLLDFIMDLNDVFIFNCATLMGEDVEKNIVTMMANSFSYESQERELSLFGEKFPIMFSSKDFIKKTLENNRWLISIVMLRFILSENMEIFLNKSKSKS